jgi:hypothetical protein
LLDFYSSTSLLEMQSQEISGTVIQSTSYIIIDYCLIQYSPSDFNDADETGLIPGPDMMADEPYLKGEYFSLDPSVQAAPSLADFVLTAVLTAGECGDIDPIKGGVNEYLADGSDASGETAARGRNPPSQWALDRRR